jgi:cytochrome c-type biogenesis protein CcmH
MSKQRCGFKPLTRCFIAACTLWWCVGVGAVSAPDLFENRMRELGEELRCLVCQNQTLADSQSGLAQDMRRIMHEMMANGATDQQITAFLVHRYGDFVRYRPPVRVSTLVLWYGPGIVLILGIGFLLRAVKQRTSHAGSAALSDAERVQLQSVLAKDPNGAEI